MERKNHMESGVTQRKLRLKNSMHRVMKIGPKQVSHSVLVQL